MKRLELVSSIVKKLKLIKVKKGFYTDIGNNCFEWYEKPLNDEHYPALIVRDPSDTCNDEGAVLKHKLRIEIDIAIKGKKAIWDMRKATRDVIKMFGQIKNELNIICSYKGSDTLIDKKDSLYGGTRLSFTIEYITRGWEQ